MNGKIIYIFQQLKNIRILQNEQFKAKAYDKAVLSIQNYGKELESGSEARKLPGIGESLAAKIDEIIRTGTVSELNGNTALDEKNKVIDLFKTVERVGNKTAERWYNLGFRKITDVTRTECTDAQWISLQLYPELSQRIPRDEIDEFARKLSETKIPFVICGSYRRGKPTSGDIDVLVTSRDDIDVLEQMLKCDMFTHTLAKGPKKYLGICKIRELHRRVDIEVAKEDEYPFAITYFTGSEGFNIKMREHASSLGLRLNEKCLLDADGNKVAVESEEKLFEVLGMEYLTPKERDNF